MVVGDFALAFVVVFTAELGDKSQLIVLAQAQRHRPWRVLAEASLAFAILAALAVTVGAFLADRLPRQPVLWASAALLVGFGLFTLLRKPEAHGPVRTGATFLLVFVGELGDKTQLATAALALRGNAWATGLGGWLAETTAAALAIAAGTLLHRVLTPRRQTIVSGSLLLAAGLFTALVAALDG